MAVGLVTNLAFHSSLGAIDKAGVNALENSGVDALENSGVDALENSGSSSSLYKRIKETGLQLAPSERPCCPRETGNYRGLQEENVAIGIRTRIQSGAQSRATGSGTFFEGLPPKPVTISAKTTFGLLRDESGTLIRSDLDSAYVQSLETGEYLTGAAENRILTAVNIKMAKAQGLLGEAATAEEMQAFTVGSPNLHPMATFQHGGQMNAWPLLKAPRRLNSSRG